MRDRIGGVASIRAVHPDGLQRLRSGTPFAGSPKSCFEYTQSKAKERIWLRQHHEQRIHRLTTKKVNDESQTDTRYEVDYRRIRLEIISVERLEIVSLRDKSEISDNVMRRIQQDLDLEEVLLSPHES
jgi:hypothetical protein